VGGTFAPGAYVTWGGFPLITTFNSSTELTATVLSGLLNNPGVVQIAVVNPGGFISSNTAFFRIGSTIQIETGALAQGFVGAPYTATLTAANGTAPYRWSATGSLPPGLTLTTEGAITGIPSAAGIFEFIAQATDAVGLSATRVQTITITQPAIGISTPAALPAGVVGQQYSQTLAAIAGTPPYQWEATSALPAGLVLNALTGAITGVPSTAGQFNFSVQLSDASRNAATRTFTVAIAAPPLSITTLSPLFSGTVGIAYAQTLSAAGGVPPYRWSIVSGNTGNLTLDAVSGNLQGTPSSPATLAFVVQAVDSAGTRAARAFTVDVTQPSLVITSASTPPTGSVGVSYRHTFSITGGTAPYTWSLLNGIPGLVLDNTGTLSGVPTVPGTVSITLAVRDAAGITTSRAFPLTITAAALSLPLVELPDGMLEESYSYQLAATGGAPPYSWSANGLPEGLSIDPTTGVISGTALAAGSYSFTVRVTDAVRATVLELLRLRVNLPPAPSSAILGVPQSASPAEQIPFRVLLGSVYPAPISGQVLLSFAPDSGGGDSTIQFASGGRTANFSVAANSLEAVSSVPLALQTGTVAGTITLSLRLQAGGIDITPVPAPSARIQIDRQSPKIHSARMIRTANGISVEIAGFSTAREVTEMSVTFAAASGQTLQNATVTVPVENLFRQWFQDTASSQFGSQFFFSQAFTIAGDANAVTAQSVTLTNRVGATNSTIQQ
jgi:large repetitive protein